MAMRDLLIGLMLLSFPTAIFAVFGAPGFEAFDEIGERRGQISAIEDGRIAYLKACARCHGRTGEGTEAGRAVVGQARAPGSLTDAALRKAMRQGVPPAGGRPGMPAQPALAERDVDGILAFLRYLDAAAVAR